jgi:hypothetical protein
VTHLRLLRSAILLLAVMLPSVLPAQRESLYEVSTRGLAGRRELTGIVDSLERAIMQPGVSESRRRGMQKDLEDQRRRLALGDFVPGDRILLRVFTDAPQRDSAGTRPDTVLISPELTIRVAGLPPISLRGVLRSELESYLFSTVSAVIRNARVSAVALVSIGVLGAVTRPGYFYVPFTSSITDAIMTAGGPSPEADPKGLLYTRGGRELWNRATMAAAAQKQVTLASLGASDGDVLVIDKVSAPVDRSFVIGAIGFVLQSVFIIAQIR